MIYEDMTQEEVDSLLDGDFSCETTEEVYAKYIGFNSMLDQQIEVDGRVLTLGEFLYYEDKEI